ncbi:MAG: hypothetical protein V3573_14485 [Desulfovibrionaceae bacterium]
MEFTGLEQILVVAMVGGLGSLVGYVVGIRGKQSISACEKHRIECAKVTQEKLDAIHARYLELSMRQDKGDSSIDTKLDTLFRMVREIVVHLPIAEQHKANILNDRGGLSQ